MTRIIPESDPIRAYHWRKLDGTTENLTVAEDVGKTYSVSGEIACCQNGLHGSIAALDGLKFAQGALCCLTEHWGEVDVQEDKVASQYRRLVAQVDATRLLHEFACDMAEDCLKTYNLVDKRTYNAIAVKRKWLDGQASNEEWEAARSAAEAAAEAAARAAAEAAANAAAAGAARSAANAAAWAAAWAAVNAAAEAARSAATAAANAAAEAAANAAAAGAAANAAAWAAAVRAAAWAAEAAAWAAASTELDKRLTSLFETRKERN